MLKSLDFFPLPAPYLMISESIGITGALFQCLAFPVFMGVCRGDKMGIFHHLEIGTKNQIF